jgi:hypothetical protein
LNVLDDLGSDDLAWTAPRRKEIHYHKARLAESGIEVLLAIVAKERESVICASAIRGCAQVARACGW